jgi:hypothetical protein
MEITHPPIENPAAEDLQNALEGLRALNLVEICAHPLDDQRSLEELFHLFW